MQFYVYLCTRFSEKPEHSTTYPVVIKAAGRWKDVIAKTY